jgi:hypothetical protein
MKSFASPSSHAAEQPLTLTLSPYEGEREPVSLVLKPSCAYDFRSRRGHGDLSKASARLIFLACFCIVLAGIYGCSRKSGPTAGDQVIISWLQSHGETNLVVDAGGVGLQGNLVRLQTSRYGSEKQKNGSFTVEQEFKIRLPDKREIIEYVAGTGETPEKAENDAKMNFLLSTFHVVYRSFLNPKDEHQTEEKLTINGRPRVLVLGDTLTRSGTTNSALDMFPLREGFRKILTNAPLNPQTHWLKIVYGNIHSNVMMCTVTLDNEADAALTEAVRKLPWPSREGFYMAKQFMVVK